MHVTIKRHTYTEHSTIGDLSIDGKRYCFTLEDKVRGDDEQKVFGETAIPHGSYRLRLRTKDSTLNEYYSKHYADIHKGMIEILNIPGYTNVYIHIGNTDSDTLGCPLLGLKAGKDEIYSSTDAYYTVYPVISAAILAGEEVTLDVINGEARAV